MADGSERRVARRFTMSLPLRVLPREARTSELRTQTRDVSYQGLYFLAEAQFALNSMGDGPIGIIGHSVSAVLALRLAASNPRVTGVMTTGAIPRLKRSKA